MRCKTTFSLGVPSDHLFVVQTRFLSRFLTVSVTFIQSFKRKPGRADNKRSIGDHSEQLKKRLRTVEEKEELAPDSRQNEGQQESDLYQHMKEEETVYDTQTYGQ